MAFTTIVHIQYVDQVFGDVAEATAKVMSVSPPAGNTGRQLNIEA